MPSYRSHLRTLAKFESQESVYGICERRIKQIAKLYVEKKELIDERVLRANISVDEAKATIADVMRIGGRIHGAAQLSIDEHSGEPDFTGSRLKATENELETIDSSI